MKIIVAAICRTNLNWFEFVRHIAATKQGQATCRSNSADEATCRSDVSPRFVASCVSAFGEIQKSKMVDPRWPLFSSYDIIYVGHSFRNYDRFIRGFLCRVFMFTCVTYGLYARGHFHARIHNLI